MRKQLPEPFTQSYREQFEDDYINGGKTLVEMAFIYKVHTTVIKKKLISLNIYEKPIRPILGLTKQKLEELVNENRRPFVHIANAYGVSPNRVGQWAKKWGVVRQTLEELATDVLTENELTRLHHVEKESLNEIAAAHNLTSRQVKQLCTRWDIPVIKRSSHNEVIIPDEALIIDLYVNKQMTMTEIGELHNTTYHTIKGKLQNLGVTIREQKPAAKKPIVKPLEKVCPECGKLFRGNDYSNKEGFCPKCNDRLSSISQKMRSRAASKGYTDTATIRGEDLRKISLTFNCGCAVTGRKNDIHFDHFIPLFIGGGTNVENIVPLDGRLNDTSKGSMHPIMWGEHMIEMGQITQTKWDFLLEYLADKNNMTVAAYREYVTTIFIDYWNAEKEPTESAS